jgi:hypothetical protein
MTVYRIIDWNEHFENSRSREIEHPAFVYMPNKQHGLGFQRLTRLSGLEGAAAFGLWVFILQACSRQTGTEIAQRSGWLTDDGTPTGTPWDADDMAMRWGMPVEFAQKVLDLLCSPRVGWMRVYDAVPQEVANDRQETAETNGRSSADHRQIIGRTLPTELNRTELNRTGGGCNTGAEKIEPTPPQVKNSGKKNREALAKILRRLGMRATEDGGAGPGTISEWADLMQGMGNCTKIDDVLEGIAWIAQEGKRNGRRIEYARDAAELADRWAGLLAGELSAPNGATV